jgi:hypothetical protein
MSLPKEVSFEEEVANTSAKTADSTPKGNWWRRQLVRITYKFEPRASGRWLGRSSITTWTPFLRSVSACAANYSAIPKGLNFSQKGDDAMKN